MAVFLAFHKSEKQRVPIRTPSRDFAEDGTAMTRRLVASGGSNSDAGTWTAPSHTDRVSRRSFQVRPIHRCRSLKIKVFDYCCHSQAAWLLTAKWFPPIALPEVRNKVFGVKNAISRGVAVVMRLAATVDSVQSFPSSQEPAVTSVALVDQRVTASRALDHRVQVVDAALRSSFPVRFCVGIIAEINGNIRFKVQLMRSCCNWIVRDANEASLVIASWQWHWKDFLYRAIFTQQTYFASQAAFNCLNQHQTALLFKLKVCAPKRW